MNSTLAFMGIGGTELIVILVVILLLFGAKKLPELARGLGQGIKEFKKASDEVTTEFQRAADESPAPPKKLPPEGSQPSGTSDSADKLRPHE